MDTIFALATAQGKAGVAVIRVSGPDAPEIGELLTRRTLPARGMIFSKLKDRDGQVLDEALVLSFTAPDSFTGENIVEFQIHGSVAVADAVLDAIRATERARLADPGEFTRRALDNGKLDLTQVEGLADLIDAETEAQRKQAQVILSGGLGKIADGWRSDLIRAASLIEVTIDFADEDVPVDVTPEVTALLQNVLTGLKTQVEGVGIAERIRTGFEVAIVGAPNVGKSTLLNALAGRNAAITSEYAGTTRDVIEVRMDLAGLPVTLLDTAGIRATDDHVEGIGIKLAQERAEAADLRVFLAEPDDVLDVPMKEGDLRLLPKADQREDAAGAVSGKTGAGIDELVLHISSTLKNRSSHAGIATRARHRDAMQTALESLHQAVTMLENGSEFYDLAAEDMRSAIRALELLVGRIDVENLLDEIFSSFCLGK
ncbi:tRNA uridine-5-carboxymethylaminomethyl(34) synthesis GTPase MnmE [Epibacterium sp. MM17-32]|uniref:tRNA uridine-5-carboxymethylaminomethyl(34) synthesis GTPase MnmE n=1 Tax=Epibacterium sp. MM17-32 TaxID=2917734 RepID=UPI001EF604E1|nr:tRNA uridine-5-carboxymethylaminomethyl(34) synthesis GTPase MnmE [Epibacterium sp. MM17-32]MCG7628286.1 tRNA uridine-5-carboxymethylaminomethyl(34) synthesis GTPase MnmE [Epibacterium sp. MM17-32]